VGQGLFTVEASRSHSDTPHSAELLCTSDEFDAASSTWQNTTPSTRYPSKREAAGPHLRTLGHWDSKQTLRYCTKINFTCKM